MLTAIQCGVFGGLLPGHERMGDRLTKYVAWPVKLACRKAFITNNSDNADDVVRSKGKVKTLQSAIGRVCLRCSKRLHLAG